ncbi:MAG: hypothetical protein AAF809_03980, partial [Bacteroidota bacterium]
PTWAHLSLNSLPFGERMFGWELAWSRNSRYFSIMEWRSTEYGKGPDIHLLLVDLERGEECVVERAEGGFIDPVKIAVRRAGVIFVLYEKRFYGRRGHSDRGYVKLDEDQVWRAVSPHLPTYVSQSNHE